MVTNLKNKKCTFCLNRYCDNIVIVNSFGHHDNCLFDV